MLDGNGQRLGVLEKNMQTFGALPGSGQRLVPCGNRQRLGVLGGNRQRFGVLVGNGQGFGVLDENMQR